MILPWWDMQASVAEIRRCHALGMRGVNCGTGPHLLGLPDLGQPHWDPLWDTSIPLRCVGLIGVEHIGAWDPATAHQPLKLPQPPTLRDNAMAALFFASGESANTTGVCMPFTDGGILAGVFLHL